MALFGKKTSVHLKIDGMTCGNCVKHVTEALEGVRGVRRVTVDLEGQRAEVESKADTDVGALVAAVVDAGYTAEPTT